MHIEQIELENFKSFKSHTTILLSRNINIIVGKNGSGKSNIVQAITFVLCCDTLSKIDKLDYIYEGNEMTDIICSVTLHICNIDMRLDSTKKVKIKRQITTEKDDYYINDKLVNKKDIIGILENGGICISAPYFIVQQGKINTMCTLNDKSRYELIKNISGALKYENERENCLRSLEDSKIIKNKLEINLNTINDKLKQLQEEKNKMEECTKLENTKRRLEIAYLQKDLVRLNKMLDETDITVMDENAYCEDIEMEIRNVTDKIQHLEREKMKYEMYFNKENIPHDVDTNDNVVKDGKTHTNSKRIDCNTDKRIGNNKKEYSDNSNDKYSGNSNNNPHKYNDNITNNTRNNKYTIEFLKNELKKANDILEKTKQEIYEKEKKHEQYKKNEKELLVDKNFLNDVINFLKIYDKNHWSKEDVISTRELLEIKTRELKNMDDGNVNINKTHTTDNSNNTKDNTHTINKTHTKNNSNNTKDNTHTMNKLIEKRKEMWRNEKKLIDDIKYKKEIISNNENKLVVTGNFSYKIYKEIMHMNGVQGCVFEMYKIPSELFKAYEAITGSRLFNIVVENENVVKELYSKIQGSVVFIPINRMHHKEPQEIEEDNMFLLSTRISSDVKYKDPKYRTLLNFICRNTYVTPDIQTGIRMHKKYNVNIVTLDGDIINKSGTLTGGYDHRYSILQEYVKQNEEIQELEDRLQNTRNKISRLNIEIETIERMKKIVDGNLTQRDVITSLCKFLEEKIKILENKGRALKWYVDKLENINYKMISLKSECVKIESTLENSNCTLLDVEDKKTRITQYIQFLTTYENEMKALQKQAASLRQKEKTKYTDKDVNTTRQDLIRKKEELLKKMGMTSDHNMEILYDDISKQEIANRLKSINSTLVQYQYLCRKKLEQYDVFINQKNEIIKRHTDLENSHKNILQFIHNLDSKKNDKMQMTFELIKTSFEQFTKKLCNFELSLEIEDDKLSIKVDDGNVKGLSGGQKTMVAICLLFSIQKVDPSPFYIFDEVDANLDEESRYKICDMFKEMEQKEGCQFVISTFRQELINCGNNFIGVTFSDKKSYASTIDKSVAYNFLVEDGV